MQYRKESGLCVRCGEALDNSTQRCQECRELYNSISRRHYEKNSIKRLKYQKEYALRNKDKRNKYLSERKKIDPQFKLSCLLRSRVKDALKGRFKSGSSISDMGCSLEQLVNHFESLFTEDMNWNNHGEWHIDHIIPLYKFDLSERSQYLEACHYKNLQPLWAEDNLRKGYKV